MLLVICLLFIQALDQIGNRTRLLWMLQDPVVPEHLKREQRAVTNDQLDLYNMAAMEVSVLTGLYLFSYCDINEFGILLFYLYVRF